MRDPDQIDNLIHADVCEQNSIILRLERELDFHKKKRDELKGMMGCDHQPEHETGTMDRCKICGYKWVR